MTNPVEKIFRKLSKKLFRATYLNLFSVMEASKLLELNVKTVYYHIKCGHLETTKWHGLILVKGESINEFLKK